MYGRRSSAPRSRYGSVGCGCVHRPLAGHRGAAVVRRSPFLFREPEMIHRTSPILTSLIVVVATAAVFAAEPKSFQSLLTHVDTALTGGPFKRWKSDYEDALSTANDWRKSVAAANDTDTRTSRTAEVIAFSGQYRVESVPVGGRQFPITSKGGYHVFVFRPTHQRSDNRWQVLPDSIRKRTYLLVRGLVPREHDPYCIVASTYLGGMTTQQVEDLVKESCRF